MSTETDQNPAEGTASEDENPSRVYRWLDDRLELDDTFLGKAFPEDAYGSFLLGEVSLFTFAILVLTGTFLGLIYTPSTTAVEYTGRVAAYAGTELPAAFASVLQITYGTRFGMTLRMVHHWAAFLFVAAMGLHMLRVFFAGSYRNPRELNWIVGSTLLFLGLAEGFLGYALPFDEYSATATGIGYEIAGTIPFIGKQLQYLVFGGSWPAAADTIIPRLFFLHVFLVPLVIGGLIAVHMLLLVRQKHTEQKGERHDSDSGPESGDQSYVVGTPLFPNQAMVTIVVFLMTFAVLFLLAAFFPVQRLPIWGPSDPASTPANVGPDWYLMWPFGILKIIPAIPFHDAISSVLGGIPVGEFIAGVVLPGIIATVLVLWPFIDYSEHEVHFTADPLDRPFPTAVGVGAISLIVMLSMAGMNATVATVVNGLVHWATPIPVLGGLFTFVFTQAPVTTEEVTLPLQIATVSVPLLEGIIVYVMLARRKRRNGIKDPSEAAAARAASQDD
ncbi:cytochrome b [Salarchaeum japonicum]|uniref:cytochrome b n=1 Tax=Salarchaeum japonicum TaxID=555573 RepID=UPI003C71A94D